MFLGDLAGTGFGTVTMDLGRELLALGHDVRFCSQNELGDLPEPFASRTFVVNDPNGHLTLGKGILGLLLSPTVWPDGWVPEAAILLGDYFAARMVALADETVEAAFRAVPTFHYVPIEGIDLPPSWAYLWSIIRPVAMSNFGADQIGRITGTRPPVVYHGVNPSDFWPVSAERPIYLGERKLHNKADCKRLFGADPRSRIMLRTDRHMPRKRYASLLRAVAPVMATRPDLWMVMHCRGLDQGGYLPDTIAKYPKPIAARMILTGFAEAGGIDRPMLNALYNAADLYVTTSAEGFGLCIAEALACGVPAIGPDFSAVPEVIADAGEVIKSFPIDNEYDHFWCAVDEREYGRRVAALIDDEVLRRRLGRLGAAHVRSSFTWPAAAAAFSDLIDAAVAERAAA